MTPLLKRALDRAAIWHRAQLRKYPGADVPYISHCAGVAVLLARHGFDDEVVAAGALHDVVEDCSVTEAELATHFGPRVASLVMLCTEEDRSAAWEDRKARSIERFAHKGWEAQAITLADKTDNLLSIVVSAEGCADPWAPFNRGREAQMARFDALAERARGLAPHPLIHDFIAALTAVRAMR